jgi:hypothetical protein
VEHGAHFLILYYPRVRVQAKKVGLAQIVVLLQQEERERKQQHAAAAMLYDLECWARVDRWVQAQVSKSSLGDAESSLGDAES